MDTTSIANAWSGPQQCENCGIRHLVLFAELEREDFSYIHQPITELEFPPGAYLYRQNDPPQFVFTMRQGLAKLVHYNKNGGQRIIRLFKRGDLVGMEALNNQPFQHYAIALETVSVCRIPIENIATLNKRTPRLYNTLTARWQQGLHEADIWLTEFSTGPARIRVANLLLYLSSIDHMGNYFFLPSREDIGSLLAITTETASRVIAEFRRQNIITVDRLNTNNAVANIPALRFITET